MLLAAKFMGLLTLAVASTYAASPTASPPIANPRESVISPSVFLYNDEGYLGSTYSPDHLPPAQCFTLPKAWQSRAESAKISAKSSCFFYSYPSCAGTGYVVSGNIPRLPEPVYGHLDSMLCTVSGSAT